MLLENLVPYGIWKKNSYQKMVKINYVWCEGITKRYCNYSFTHPPHFLEDILHHLHILYTCSGPGIEKGN